MTGEHERGVELIESAFAAARNTGSPGWRSMTSAVLKNRILDLTNREFDEADWGADSFRAFLGQFNDILRVDPSKRPMQVTLLEERSASIEGSTLSPVLDLGRERQIRRDLWNRRFESLPGPPSVANPGCSAGLRTHKPRSKSQAAEPTLHATPRGVRGLQGNLRNGQGRRGRGRRVRGVCSLAKGAALPGRERSACASPPRVPARFERW